MKLFKKSSVFIVKNIENVRNIAKSIPIDAKLPAISKVR